MKEKKVYLLLVLLFILLPFISSIEVTGDIELASNVEECFDFDITIKHGFPNGDPNTYYESSFTRVDTISGPIGGDEDYVDYCSNSDELKEYYCYEGGSWERTITCECADGACVSNATCGNLKLEPGTWSVLK